MTSNAPPFDPLHPAPDEEADMVAGYRAAVSGFSKPAITSAAFDHGWRNGRSDRAHVIDDDQRALARRAIQERAL